MSDGRTSARVVYFLVCWQTVRMLSTPISHVRSRHDDDEDDAEATEQFAEGGDSELSMDDEDGYVRDDAPAGTYGGDPGMDGDDNIIPARASCLRSSSTRGTARSRRVSNGSNRSGRDNTPMPAPTGYFGSPVWRAVISKPFFQAIVLAFAIICAVVMSPASSMIISRIPAPVLDCVRRHDHFFTDICHTRDSHKTAAGHHDLVATATCGST